MKKYFLIIMFSMFAMLSFADDTISVAIDSTARPLPRIMQVMENVKFYGDESVAQLLADRIDGTEREQVQIQGYRVQVFSSNQGQTAKNEAFRIQQLLEEAGLNAESYVLFNPPFWKVRIGNYRTQDEAMLMKEEVISKLPELQTNTYIVRDQITVLQ